jgi:SAM-dependent methyltransferase
LEPAYRAFSEANVLREVEEVLSAVSREKFCRLLWDADRLQYEFSTILEMRDKLPEMMARKIPRANVQQAWTVDLVRRTRAKRVLCVGCFEDTGYELLMQYEGEFLLVGIDSAQGMSLRRYRQESDAEFECVFATSVIEHVPDDEQFIRDLCDCLVSDGVCILTADFKEGWKRGQPLPATDERLYTSADIARIGRILREKNCYFVDQPDTSGEPDFHYQGHDYSFIGLVFKKL